MKNFWTSDTWKAHTQLAILSISFFTANIIVSREAEKMPSVAEVFGGLSEQQIAEQVQMGQKFLEDLEKNGTPEERAEFERLLIETLNTMSEDDFKDIQAIAQMVEPHIDIPQEQPKIATETKPAKQETVSAEVSELEEFKKLISTITQRIDDILQKLNSSKECSEEIDVKWKSKTTFSNMKRQIYQLRTDRLAKKLAIKDLTGDEKELVETLKKFLKDLTKENDALAIEDDFGLPASFTTEKKHLKQTKSILNMFDDYIDKLMPMLEKFLRKWDPEALQMAKEAEEKTKKAVKDANDATIRRGSFDARPTPGGTSTPRSSGAGPQDYGAYPAEYYDQGGYGYPGGYGAQAGYSPDNIGAGSGVTSGSGKAKSEKTPTTPADKEKSKEGKDGYRNIIDNLDSHFDDYPQRFEDKFADFIDKEIINNYPDITKIVEREGGTLAAPDESGWVNSKTGNEWGKINFKSEGFEYYVQQTYKKLESDFYPELKALDDILDGARHATTDLTTDHAKKLQTSKDLASAERRLERYEKAYQSLEPQFENIYNKNVSNPVDGVISFGGIQNENARTQYTQAHKAFTERLHQDLGKRIKSLLNEIKSIKRRAKKKATQKAS